MQDSSLTGNQQVYQQALDSIQKEIDDMEAAEIAASQAGKGLADYDLSAATAKVRQARVAAEQLMKQEQSMREEEARKVMIGGKEVEGTGIATSTTEQKDEIITRGKEGGPEERISRIGVQVGEAIDVEKVIRNPYEQINFIESITGSDGNIRAGKRYKFEPGMEKEYPQVQEYMKEHGKPAELVEVEDWANLIGGKPTIHVEALPSRNQAKENLPTLEQSKGKDINPLYHWAQRMDKATGEKSGTTYKRLQKGESYREIMGLPPQ